MTRAAARPGRGMVSSNQPRRNGPGGGGESPPLRVLLVIPDENDYAVARGLLTEIPTRRYAVAWARTYEEGVAAVRRDAHDVYLVDYRLGTRSGIDLLADARGCRGPIILLTGAGDRAIDEAAMRAGAADYLERTRLDPSLLERSIRYALERKRTEHEMAAGEERLRDVLDHSHDLIYAASADGQLNYVNRTWQTALGYPRQQADAMRAEDLVAPEFRDAFRDAVALALSNARPDGVPVDTIFVASDRSRLVVTGTITCRLEHDVPVETQGWFRNVTEQRRAEEAQRRLAVTLEETTDFVGIGDTTGTAVYLNRAGRRMVGIPDDADVSQLRFETLHATHARDRLLREALPTAARDGTWHGESVLLSADGHEIPVSQVIIAHPSAQGGVWFVSTIMRDISEWKRLDEMKSEFVSTVSHELRTPLTSIRGSLGLLEAGVAGTLPTQAHDLVRIARGNSERLIRLINEMLDLDKIEAGKLELRAQPLTPAELVRTAVDEIRPLADLFHVQVEQHVEAHRSFEGDRDRVLQVLVNLLSNAVKFSPSDSVITVSAVAATEAELVNEKGGRVTGRAPVRFVVENPGPGIPARDRPRLFTRFQQLDGSDGRRRGGTGLGLAISKAIVEQHGGRIGVESEPGRQTKFWFELPAVLPGSPAASA
jgi:PAS domain S-box-containing protein